MRRRGGGLGDLSSDFLLDLRRGRLLGRRLPRPVPTIPCRPAGRPGRLHAGLQGAEQVGHAVAVVGRLLGHRRRAALPGGALALDQLDHGVAVLVVELGRVEVGAEALHQRRGHGQLLRAQVDLGVEDVELGLAHLVGPEHGLQHDRPCPAPAAGPASRAAAAPPAPRPSGRSAPAPRAAARTAWPPWPPAPGSSSCRTAAGRSGRPARTRPRRSRARTAVGSESRSVSSSVISSPSSVS